MTSLIWCYSHDSFIQGEIDAREDIFKSTNQFGQSLVAAQHYANEEIKEKVRSSDQAFGNGTEPLLRGNESVESLLNHESYEL